MTRICELFKRSWKDWCFGAFLMLIGAFLTLYWSDHFSCGVVYGVGLSYIVRVVYKGLSKSAE